MKPLNDGLSPKSRETAAAGLVGHLQVRKICVWGEGVCVCVFGGFVVCVG